HGPVALRRRATDGRAGAGTRVAASRAARRRAVVGARAGGPQTPRAHAGVGRRVGRGGAADRAVRPRRDRAGQHRLHPRGWPHPLPRDGRRAEGQPRAPALGLPPAGLAVDDLAGRVAVITGAASGIGLAMAHRFAGEGMKLVLADIERPVLQRVGEELGRAGADVLTVPTDVSLEAEVTALAETALEHF